MQKIMILGAGGMAGHMINAYLERTQKYVVYPFYHQGKRQEACLDVVDLKAMKEKIRGIKPDIIINAVGMLNKNSEQQPMCTAYMNTFVPQFLQWIGDKEGIKVITISTDCVFSGTKGNYTNNDFKDAEDMYGLSKNFGEIKSSRHLTIRTSIIGPELKDGIGLFHWFMKQSGTVYGYTKVYWSGVTTLMLAKAVESAIEAKLVGIHTLSNNKKISKFELLELLKDIFKKTSVTLEEDATKSSDKSLVCQMDRRQFYVPNYREMLEEMKVWMKQHPEVYKQYEPLA